MERNYYEILGVEKTASPEQIKEAYREIARVYHPDSNFYDEIIEDAMPSAAMDKFKQITAAYNTLINEQKRKEYNETLPPELSDWESSGTGELDNGWIQRKTRESGVYAMGHFGNLKSRGEERLAPEEQALRSVAEYTREILAPWYLKLWWKLVN